MKVAWIVESARPTGRRKGCPCRGWLALAAALLVLAALLWADFFPWLEPVSRRLPDAPAAEGPWAPNSLLDEAQLLFPDLVGAECFAVVGDDLITGLLDGRVVRLKGNSTQILLGCEATPCGRPMGLRFDPATNHLYVADATLGLLQLNLANGLRTLLSPASTPVSGLTSRLTDDLAVTQEGDVYFTDASSKWGFDYLHLDFAEGSANGRILHYDPRTQATRLVLDQLYFPNGIQLSPDEDYFLFCESAGFRILKYHLRGPLRGQVEVFADNLPGYPDNIRASGRGTYWVALPILRAQGRPSLAEYLSSSPQFLKVVTRFPYLLALLFKPFDHLKLTQGFYPSALNLANWLEISLGTGSGRGFVLELDPQGHVLRSLQASESAISRLSTALEHAGTLYMGSPWQAGVYALKLN